jgi:hypothetical protein
MAGISEFIDSLVKDGKVFAKDELKSLLKDAGEDNRLFIRHMGELTEEFIKLRALNQINNDEFSELMGNVVDLNKMQFQKLSVAAKARAQKIANGLTDLVLNSLMALI